MPLVVFIPADEAQLGRWDLGEPEGKRLFWKATGPVSPSPGLLSRWEGLRPWGPLKWSPVSLLPAVTVSRAAAGRLGALGKARAFQAVGSASVNGGEYTWLASPQLPGLLGAQTSRLVENTDILAQGLDPRT